ncbi:two-component system sensor histidine kinase NtrB [Oricola cellulosilytica]|uniref:histidine kinase n=1 Tax=Oricola cellulosilytica TaxID=1429082 RepID=A0A4R0PD59_9HYPH|nr:nitrogen regulation protein NR(II) [Oricola cellulosilytica]TCD13143.1 nitrogen regulation protein NR(II) [Oricola cellulosilytica]
MSLEARKNSNNSSRALQVLDTLRDPVVMIDNNDMIAFANLEAEYFFSSSQGQLAKSKIQDFVPFSSPFLALIAQVRGDQSPINEYRVDLSSPRLGADRIVDVHVTPVSEEPGAMVIVFRERSMAEKFDRQMTHRGAARSVTGLASMLGHEIKNPLSGIRGAAQLLEAVVSDEDRALTGLIRDETDRIVSLVERMEVFSDERPIEREAVNIHVVLDRVHTIATSGFARGIEFVKQYDPSLPSVLGNKDQLIQVFLNLVKNASEACRSRENAQIKLRTAFRPGVRLSIPGANERVALPLEFCIEDNGPGVPEDIQMHMFDPFITTKQNGSGLGLALVAKTVGDHGGVIECDSQTNKTIFRILMPAAPRSHVAGELYPPE